MGPSKGGSDTAGFSRVYHCPASFSFLLWNGHLTSQPGAGTCCSAWVPHTVRPPLTKLGRAPACPPHWAGHTQSVEQIQAEYPPRHQDTPSLDSPSQRPEDTLAGAIWRHFSPKSTPMDCAPMTASPERWLVVLGEGSVLSEPVCPPYPPTPATGPCPLI